LASACSHWQEADTHSEWQGTTLLESLGVSEPEERVYRAILRDPIASLDDLALALCVSPAQLRTLLSALERKGLIGRSPARNCGYAPVIPDVAVEGLIQRRQEEFDVIRTYLPQLRREYQHPADREIPAEFVEVVSGRLTVAQWFARVQMVASETILVFDRPPYVRPDEGESEPINPLQFRRMEEGIQYRVVYANGSLAFPGQAEAIRAFIKAGEDARVSSHVPMKLAIADRRLALMPIISHPQAPDAPSQVESAFVIHQSSLLDALATLFDAIWETALPLSPAAVAEKKQGATDDDADDADEEDRERLLELLTAGLTDEVIARQLGISIRTVRRRIRRMMDELGAVSRFQAGLQAAKRGWV
jgi:DNA-binding CsgD family transcriptional regulator